VSSENIDNPRKSNISRKDNIGIDDDTMESLKQYYKIGDSEGSEIFRFVKNSRPVEPEEE
jgi:hypothetical protein